MLEIGKIYRISRKEKNPDVTEVDGLPNFFHETAVPHAGTQFEVQRGIHVFSKVTGADGNERIPLIFITSSPYKAGSEDTPWKDYFDPDHGKIKYYGDNKSSEIEAEDTPGNRALLKLMQIYSSNDSEIRASQGVPLLYFERVTVDGRMKGNLKFQGFGIVTSAERINQFKQDKNSGRTYYFSNYQYNLAVFSLKQEQEKFDFIKWIGARYDSSLTAEETNQYAPQSWRDWIGAGVGNLTKVRREISGPKIVRYVEQLPNSGSTEFRLLTKIYEIYTNSMQIHNFEALAMEVTRKVIEENGASFIPGWLLPKSDKYNEDFVLRMDIGRDILTGVKLPIIGHANCVHPTQVIIHNDIKHLYEIVKSGWAVAYVTTSFFSESVQKEAFSSAYPIIMINGRKIAQVVHDELFANKLSIEEYLDSLEKLYTFRNRNPEEIIDL